MEEYQDINVVSVVADPDDLFGDNGIYVTGREYDEWYAGDRGPADILVNFLKKGCNFLNDFFQKWFLRRSIFLRCFQNRDYQQDLKVLEPSDYK